MGLFNMLYIPVFLFMLILQQVKFLYKEEDFLFAFVCLFLSFFLYPYILVI